MWVPFAAFGSLHFRRAIHEEPVIFIRTGAIAWQQHGALKDATEVEEKRHERRLAEGNSKIAQSRSRNSRKRAPTSTTPGARDAVKDEANKYARLFGMAGEDRSGRSSRWRGGCHVPWRNRDRAGGTASLETTQEKSIPLLLAPVLMAIVRRCNECIR
jgi:hypothetical protein